MKPNAELLQMIASTKSDKENLNNLIQASVRQKITPTQLKEQAELLYSLGETFKETDPSMHTKEIKECLEFYARVDFLVKFLEKRYQTYAPQGMPEKKQTPENYLKTGLKLLGTFVATKYLRASLVGVAAGTVEFAEWNNHTFAKNIVHFFDKNEIQRKQQLLMLAQYYCIIERAHAIQNAGKPLPSAGFKEQFWNLYNTCYYTGISWIGYKAPPLVEQEIMKHVDCIFNQIGKMDASALLETRTASVLAQMEKKLMVSMPHSSDTAKEIGETAANHTGASAAAAAGAGAGAAKSSTVSKASSLQERLIGIAKTAAEQSSRQEAGAIQPQPDARAGKPQSIISDYFSKANEKTEQKKQENNEKKPEKKPTK